MQSHLLRLIALSTVISVAGAAAASFEEEVGRLLYSLDGTGVGRIVEVAPPPLNDPTNGSFNALDYEPAASQTPEREHVSFTYQKIGECCGDGWDNVKNRPSSSLRRTGGALRIEGTEQDDTIIVHAASNGAILVNHGSVGVRGGPATIHNTRTIRIESLGGNDTIMLLSGIHAHVDAGEGANLIVRNAPHSLRLRHLYTADLDPLDPLTEHQLTVEVNCDATGNSEFPYQVSLRSSSAPSRETGALVERLRTVRSTVEVLEQRIDETIVRGTLTVRGDDGGWSAVEHMLNTSGSYDLEVRNLRLANGQRVAFVGGPDWLAVGGAEPVRVGGKWLKVEGVAGESP